MALDPETLDQLLVTLRKFVVEKLVPLEAQVAEDDLVPPAIVEQMKGRARTQHGRRVAGGD